MRVKLRELGEIVTGNTPSKQVTEFWDSDDICFVKPDTINETGISSIQSSVEHLAEAARSKARVVGNDAVLVTCIGSIGKIGITGQGEFAFNQQINAIIPNRRVNPKYLAYALLFAKPQLIAIANAPVVPIINKSQFGDFEINIAEGIQEQVEVSRTLDIAAGVISKRQQQLSALDDLIKARFVEMFGDPLLNPMNWQEKMLEEISDIVSGITKGRKVHSTELYEVPYMAVSNVKDGYIDWTTVKTILATQAEIDQYRLLPNDVLMTEGGDPDKLGRGAIIHEPPSDCIHQNHIFRVRLDQSIITPEFMEHYLQHQKAKQYFLGCAKQTTGIASINMKQLRSLPMLMPPIALQREFTTFVAKIEKSKSVIQKALDETQLLFDSLMQQYFG